MLVFNERTGEFEERLGPGEKPTIGGSTNKPANLPNSSNSSFDNRPTREYVHSKVIEILSDVLFVERDEIEEWNDLQDDLFADSVDAQEIIERVEDEFGITVLDEEAEEIIDVDGMIDFICDELNIDYDDEYFEFDNTWTSDDEDEDLDDDDDDFDEDDDWDEDDEDFDEDLDDDDDDDWYDKLDEEGKRNVLLEVVKSMARDFRSGYNPKFAPMSEHLYRRDIIQDTVFGIIADKFGIDYDVINEDSCFVTDLGADSLDIVDLIMALEKEFGLSIPDNDVEELITVGDAVDYIYYNAN